MKKEKSPYSIFAISFVITFSALLIVVMLVLSVTVLNKNETPPQTEDISMSYFRPEAEDAFKILLITCNDKSEVPYAYTVLDFNPSEKTLGFIRVSGGTEVTVNTRADTLNGHYDFAGCDNAKIAVSNILLQDVQRYIRIDKNGIENLIDTLGGFEKTLNHSYNNDSLSLSAGKNILSGKTVLKLLNDTPNEIFEDFESFLTEFISQKLKKDIIEKGDYIFEAVLNNVDTDITQFDYASHKKVLRYFLESENKKFTLKEVKAES